MKRSPKLLCFWFILSVLCPALIAQNPQTPTLRQTLRRPAYTFTGTVTAVEHIDAGESAVATVQITFHVDRAIRGVRMGQSLTIREWSGLWTGGERYFPGQHVVLSLFRPSKLGLTSTVGTPWSGAVVDQGGTALQPAWVAEPNESLPLRTTMKGMSVRDFAHHTGE